MQNLIMKSWSLLWMKMLDAVSLFCTFGVENYEILDFQWNLVLNKFHWKINLWVWIWLKFSLNGCAARNVSVWGFVGCRPSWCHTCRFVALTFCLDYTYGLLILIFYYYMVEQFDNMCGGKLHFQDVFAYRAVGIPISRIFTINSKGELRHELTQTFQTS